MIDDPHLEALAAHDGRQDVVEPPFEDLVLNTRARSRSGRMRSMSPDARHLPVERGHSDQRPRSWRPEPGWPAAAPGPAALRRRAAPARSRRRERRRVACGRWAWRYQVVERGRTARDRHCARIIRGDADLTDPPITILSLVELRARNWSRPLRRPLFRYFLKRDIQFSSTVMDGLLTCSTRRTARNFSPSRDGTK